MKKYSATIVLLIFAVLSMQAQIETVDQYIAQPECAPTGGLGPVTTTKDELPEIVMPEDSDGDGIPDEIEGTADIDGDGIPNYLDTDSDGDEVSDKTDKCWGVSGAPPSGCLLPPGDRNVFWIHGYRGNSNSFLKVADHVQNTYKAHSIRLDYSANQESLASSADRVGTLISDFTWDIGEPRNFIIAHSMGGLVARTLGQMKSPDPPNAPLYDGLITFGTPHQGAYAADILVSNPNLLNNILTEACQNLASGPIKNEVANSSMLGAIAVMFGIGDGKLDKACENLVDFALPPILKFAETGVEEELTTTAVASIPPMATTHNAVFYGVEDGLEVKVDGSALSDGSLTPRFIGAIIASPNSFETFQADASDVVGIAEVASWFAFYETRVNLFSAFDAIDCVIPPWPTENCLWSPYKKLLKAYQKGLDWLPKIDPIWQELIGARQTILHQTCTCLIEEGGEFDVNWDVVCFGPCDDQNTPWECDSYDCDNVGTDVSTEIVFKESDAFILAESAMNGPCMTYDARLMEGSNHLQMRNDSQMKDAIKKIFEDGLGGTYFKTDKR